MNCFHGEHPVWKEGRQWTAVDGSMWKAIWCPGKGSGKLWGRISGGAA